MTKRIKTTEATVRPIRDTSTCLPRIDPAQVQEALGAEASDEALERALSPVTLFAVREELVKRLQSSGGRPALPDPHEAEVPSRPLRQAPRLCARPALLLAASVVPRRQRRRNPPAASGDRRIPAAASRLGLRRLDDHRNRLAGGPEALRRP